MKRIRYIISFCILFGLNIFVGCSIHTSSPADNLICSNIDANECILCGNNPKSQLTYYGGQENIGIINLNSFDIIPLDINQYNNNGELINQAVNHTVSKLSCYDENDLQVSVSSNPNRDYADGYVVFNKDTTLDTDQASNLYCQTCLTQIVNNYSFTYGIGIIDFQTNEIQVFKNNETYIITEDYYISYNIEDESDVKNTFKVNFSAFYCPNKYN